MPDSGHDSVKEKMESLKPPQLAIAKRIADGDSDAEIAQEHSGQTSVVQAHIREIAAHLGVTGSYNDGRAAIGIGYRQYLGPADNGKRPGTNGAGANKPFHTNHGGADETSHTQKGTTMANFDTRKLGAKLAGLPKRHHGVAECIAAGITDKAGIKKKLDLKDENTAGIYVGNLYRALGINKIKENDEKQRLVTEAVKKMPEPAEAPKKKRAANTSPKKRANTAKKKKTACKTSGTGKQMSVSEMTTKQKIKFLNDYANSLDGGGVAEVLKHIAEHDLPAIERAHEMLHLTKDALAKLNDAVKAARDALPDVP